MPLRLVRQFHDVVEIALAAANLQNVHHAFVRTGDRFEFLDALELALEGMVMPKGVAPDKFDRAQRADNAASQPHFAIAALADLS